jgi:alkaline phosphatase D
MGPQKAINLQSLADYAPANSAPFVKAYTNAILNDPGSFIFRAAVAMDLTDTPYNRDGFDGFAYERANLLNGFAKHTNNPIILGGDLHDSWAWTLYEAGNMSGKPAAVNLGCPGVTSPGWGPLISGLFAPLVGPLGGQDNVYKLIADNFVGINTGLVFADIQKKGFVAVKATQVSDSVVADKYQCYEGLQLNFLFLCS